ncbi:alpha-sarcoglycan-like isoform X2 [Homarus americanus]|uniref:alpha-sarcoglycan-like isoform X2 n=1 Tax=Homarus americanus TaxID=6706 RepID=UPI001C473343|nr:alpha-sarcoglycan-like isoform X2 [Homarus americanus]
MDKGGTANHPQPLDLTLRRMLMWLGVLCLLLGSPDICVGSEVLSSQLFILPLTHQNFSLPTAGVTYRPSLLNMPDLPSWLHYTYSPGVHTGFVYGVPPEGIHDFQVEVIARDKHTYETSHHVFKMEVLDQASKPYEVRFKIQNMNVEELLVGRRWDRLHQVISNDLWQESADDLIVTSLASATQRGDRLPASPDEKEGVYVSYGSSVPFSAALLELEKEVEPLWHHQPCPAYFKKTSYERFFRQQNFAVDWCSFKLYENKKNMMIGEDASGEDEGPKSPVISALENEGRVYLQRRDQVEKRSYTFDVVHTILIPLVVMLVLLALLTLAMCCHRNNMDQQSSDFFDELFDDFPRIPTGQDIQMVQYASIHRATEALRTLKGREHSPHPSTATTTTQADTLTRSRTASPSSTLPRNSTLSRRFEDYATLSRPDPPPYQRNGTTPTR